jgi:hypothetical protein
MNFTLSENPIRCGHCDRIMETNVCKKNGCITKDRPKSYCHIPTVYPKEPFYPEAYVTAVYTGVDPRLKKLDKIKF